jgi:hypothetical protein
MKDKQHMIQIGVGYLNLSGADEYNYEQRLVSHADKTKHLKAGVASVDLDGTDGFTTDVLGIYGSFQTAAEYKSYKMDSMAN